MRTAATLALLASIVPQHAFAQGASLETTPGVTAPAGSTITVKWSGPNGPGDFITVARKGAAPSDYFDYRPTSDGRTPANPLSLRLPAEPGAYEIRYVRGNPRSVLGLVPYQVTAIAASIDGPASVSPGARFQVSWSGPNNSGDWVTIVEAGAVPRAYGSYVDARTGTADSKTGRSTTTLRAPDKPGRYELRYVQQGTLVIGTRAIAVATTSSATSTLSPVALSPVVPVLTIPLAQTPSSDQRAAGDSSAPPLLMAPSTSVAGLKPTTGGAVIDAISPRTIALVGFTGAGTAVIITPRTISSSGFTGVGTAVVIPPRTIALDGWTGTGSSTTVQGVIIR